MELEFLLDKYLKYKDILDRIESGNWREDKVIANLTIDQVMHVKYIVSQLEGLGIRKLSSTLPN